MRIATIGSTHGLPSRTFYRRGIRQLPENENKECQTMSIISNNLIFLFDLE